MTHRWNSFLDYWGDNPLKIYSENSDFPNMNVLAENNLGDASEVKRNSSAIICKRKTKESDAACVLRHIRNAIAHAHVSVNDAGNRKYILFEDYNRNGRKTAILLFSQTNLSKLRTMLQK